MAKKKKKQIWDITSSFAKKKKKPTGYLKGTTDPTKRLTQADLQGRGRGSRSRTRMGRN